MPDKSKLDALKSIGYKILPTCGICEHALISKGASWGTCSAQTYTHGKHSGVRNPSIHCSGTCPTFQLSVLADKTLSYSGFDIYVNLTNK